MLCNLVFKFVQSSLIFRDNDAFQGYWLGILWTAPRSGLLWFLPHRLGPCTWVGMVCSSQEIPRDVHLSYLGDANPLITSLGISFTSYSIYPFNNSVGNQEQPVSRHFRHPRRTHQTLAVPPMCPQPHSSAKLPSASVHINADIQCGVFHDRFPSSGVMFSRSRPSYSVHSVRMLHDFFPLQVTNLLWRHFKTTQISCSLPEFPPDLI